MINLTIDWQRVTINFQGEEVSALIRPLMSKTFVSLMPFMHIDKDESRAAENMITMQQLGKDIFPDHMKELEGVQINGAAPTVEQLTEEFALAELAVKLLTEMINITVLDKDSEKNFSSPPQSQ